MVFDVCFEKSSIYLTAQVLIKENYQIYDFYYKKEINKNRHSYFDLLKTTSFDILKKTSTKLPFKFFSLTDNTPVLTAIANDIGYENVLVSQLKIHFKKGDVVILISASGNSKNLLKASQWINKKKNNGYIFSFLGFNGGKLKSYSNDYILVNT